ncbi:hypothetical protein [Limnoglobus roseus]|uniref:Uncharacterized protein n=1 Tax=Limnoglobus roseus TaxID=2598579 RepID=A0A5C1AJ74_9BACT|nr:hypothetical protein [Limnoglobus roseus]QEL19509.1 hypothetical protein PX52LOC_06583 [Limnoglobus roseus]
MPAIIKGFAGNSDAVRKLTGKGVVNAPANQTDLVAKSDAGDSCRLLLRTLRLRDWGEEASKADVKTEEVKVKPGLTYRWVLNFERPIPRAKRLLIDLPAADMGGQGVIRLDVPNVEQWKGKD